MLKLLEKIIGKIIFASFATFLFLGYADFASAKIVFKNEFLLENTGANSWVIDSGDDATGDLTLQFGNSLAETITFDTVNTWFEFSDDVNFNQNQLVEAEIENVSVLPGGGAGLGAAGEGRLVILDTLDSTAPGCTISPFCAAGPWIWDGSTWISLAGGSSSELTKVVTVGASGFDYTTIDAAATYLQTRSGGIMLLAAETHAVTTAVDLTNVIIIGKDASRSTIELDGAGQLDSFDTTLKFLTLSTLGTLTDDMAIDIQAGSSSIIFEYVDFDITTGTDVVIDSNEGTAPTFVAKFISSNDAGGSGSILKTTGSANVNTASEIFIDSRSSDNPLQLEDWDVTLAGGGSVNTSGIITPVPADSIFVSPNMNLQGAIDSLEFSGNGGQITLLPGTHTITATLTIEDDNIEIVGYGDSSIISASGITGGDTVGAIQVGAADGTTPVDGVVLRDFKLEVTGTGVTDIHGIRVAGGMDNRIDNVTVQKVSGASGSGANARMGIQMIDGTAEVLSRPVITNSRVFGTEGVTAYFIDGIHITSDPDISGVFGNDQGVENALVEGNNVDYVGETAYVFVGVDDASLFNNRASDMAASGGGYGIFVANADKVNMTANIFSGSNSATSPAIGIEDFDTGGLKETTNSIFNNNIIDGLGNSGVGFDVAFQIGEAANTGVHNNIFQNNVIIGPSVGTTTAIELEGDADDNQILNNQIDGNGNGWDTAIDLQNSTIDRTIVRGNIYQSVTTIISDSGTATLMGVGHHEATTDPTTGDDIGDGYGVGTIWINTNSGNSFILSDNTAAAAVWDQIGGAKVFYAYDGTGGQAITGTEVTVNIDTTVVADSIYSLATDQVTVSEAGLYKITARVGLDDINTTGGARMTNEVRIQNNAADIAGAVAWCYHRETTSSICELSILQTLSASDVIRIRSIRIDGSTAAQTEVDTSSLMIERIR